MDWALDTVSLLCLDPEDDAAGSRPGTGEWGHSLDMCVQDQHRVPEP